MITASRLLKSWAIPPASRPTASIFCDWRSWSSSRRASVMSRSEPWNPRTRPLLVEHGHAVALEAAIGAVLVAEAQHEAVPAGAGSGALLERAAAAARSSSWRSAFRLRPRSSSGVQPRICSTAGLLYSLVPSASIDQIHSLVVSTIER